MSDNKMENVSIKERAKQLKAVRSILRGEEVQKTVMVGYEGKKQKQGDIESPLTSIMQKVRMPWFCPECKKTMKKRLDDKMWFLYGHCFDCQVNIEHKMRIEGTYDDWASQKAVSNKLSWIQDQKEKLIEFKNQKQPEFHNQVAADGYSVDKEKWNVDFKKLKEQADEALNHLQKLEDSLI